MSNGHTMLSVIVPNFNHRATLYRAVESHLRQSHSPAEIIIVDDCSTDGSVAAATAICQRYPQVRLIARSMHGGPNAAIAEGLLEARGDYIHFGGADDFVSPHFAESAIASLASHPAAAFCFFDPSEFNEENGRYQSVPLALADEPAFFSPREFEALLRRNMFTISANTVVYRRSAISALGGFPVTLEWQADWFANLVLAFRHGVCYRPEAPAHFVVNSSSYGSTGLRLPGRQRDLLLACIEALNDRHPDVAAQFRAAGVVPEMSIRALWWMLADRLGRRFLSRHLVTRLIAREIWNWMRPLTPTPVRRWMRRRAGRKM